jgi:PAS domain S-box-containing protein
VKTIASPLFHECVLERDDPLRILLEGTASATGERFFETLVENMALALGTRYAWITEYIADLRRLRTLAFWSGGELMPGFEIDIVDTPCEAAIGNAQLVFYPDNIQALFPNSHKLKELGAVSYIGVPLLDLNGATLGQLAVIHNRPLPEEHKRIALLSIFAARAAAEMQRLRAEAQVKEHEEKLSHLVASAMDAIIELDDNMDIVLLNPAAETLLGCRLQDVCHMSFPRFLTPASLQKLTAITREVTARPGGRRSLWVPGGLEVIRDDGTPIAAEATLSQFEMQLRPFYTLILRNINERIEAEQNIHILREETAYLKKEIKDLDNFEQIVGHSRTLQKVLHSVQQVAETDSTVLILGETGTGKELVARAVHRHGHRSDKPFIKLNCAVLPANLVESELFGHESGAFTGAERRQRGRFELADRGTFFLDEIGELSLEVQAKLLRVLQEGQFERVGGARTLSVDVRVIAASNCNLQQEILAGRFRADLFYRLNVYPITVPPLRDRKEDIPLLVEYFVARISSRIRKVIRHIPALTIEQLIAYDWPGNVRELKNVIERAIITSPGDALHLPEPLGKSLQHMESAAPDQKSELPTLETIERNYITRVLQATGWRLSGPKGAARILDVNPSTLRYRIKKLGIATPW